MCNISLSMSEKILLKFSDGWPIKFKRRCKLKTRKAHEEAENLDKSATQEALSTFKNKIASFHRRDIFNADECSHFYKLALDATVVMRRPGGYTKMKDCMTVLICANSNGSEKFSLIFIRAELQLRPF